MPRRRRLRKVVAPPKFRGYKPYGSVATEKEPIELMYEEYEAIKLADFHLMIHKDACEKMGVSRATFARIYEEARRKIAKAMVEAREIKTVYGHAELNKNWYICDNCQARFTLPKRVKEHICPMCKSDNIVPVNRHLK